MLNYLKSIISFFKHPVEELEEVHKLTSKLKWFFGLMILNIVLVAIAGYLQRLPIKFGFVEPGQHSVTTFIAGSNIYIVILIIAIVGPIVEELIFRLPLKIKRYNFVPLIVFGILLNGIGILYQQLNESYWYLFIPVILTIIASVLVFNPTSFGKISNFLRLKYGWYFYFVALLFGFYHLTNYQYASQVLWFAPILVLPQIVAGLFLGFIRIKLGLIWSILMHSVYNLLFLLPVYLTMNSTNHVHLPEINKDGYTIEIAEEGDSVFFYGSNIAPNEISPNEIILGGTLKKVISLLEKKSIENILFENKILGEKLIGVHFKNDSAYDSPSTAIARQLTMQHLLSNYNLKIEKGEQLTGVFTLSITNQNQFQNHRSKNDSLVTEQYYRSFYGKNDTIELAHINAEYLKKSLEINFDVFVENEMDNNLIFSVKIPNGKISNTANYLVENYGISLKRDLAKKEFLIVK